MRWAAAAAAWRRSAAGGAVGVGVCVLGPGSGDCVRPAGKQQRYSRPRAAAAAGRRHRRHRVGRCRQPRQQRAGTGAGAIATVAANVAAPTACGRAAGGVGFAMGTRVTVARACGGGSCETGIFFIARRRRRAAGVRGARAPLACAVTPAAEMAVTALGRVGCGAPASASRRSQTVRGSTRVRWRKKRGRLERGAVVRPNYSTIFHHRVVHGTKRVPIFGTLQSARNGECSERLSPDGRCPRRAPSASAVPVVAVITTTPLPQTNAREDEERRPDGRGGSRSA